MCYIPSTPSITCPNHWHQGFLQTVNNQCLMDRKCPNWLPDFCRFPMHGCLWDKKLFNHTMNEVCWDYSMCVKMLGKGTLGNNAVCQLCKGQTSSLSQLNRGRCCKLLKLLQIIIDATCCQTQRIGVNSRFVYQTLSLSMDALATNYFATRKLPQ